MKADVAIIGGGPAGLAAARELRLRGVKEVLVFERENEAGGVPRLCHHSPFGILEFGLVMTGPSYARKLIQNALAAGVSILTRHSVVELGDLGRLRIASPQGLLEAQARRVILATGARELPRAQRLISGDRPSMGCLTTGALQSFLHQYKIVPFLRPLILGTEFVSLSAILTCRRAGIRPVAIVEEDLRSTVPKPFSFLPRVLGIPVHFGAHVIEIRGTRRVESATIRLSDGTAAEIPCDGILCTGRFVPEAGILRKSNLSIDAEVGRPLLDTIGRCSDNAYFAAGNVSHEAKTAASCYREGRRIGRVIAEEILGPLAKR